MVANLPHNLLDLPPVSLTNQVRNIYGVMEGRKIKGCPFCGNKPDMMLYYCPEEIKQGQFKGDYEVKIHCVNGHSTVIGRGTNELIAFDKAYKTWEKRVEEVY